MKLQIQACSIYSSELAIKSDEPAACSSKQFSESNRHHLSMDSSFVLVEDDKHTTTAPPGKEQPTPAKKQVRHDIFGAPEPLLGSLEVKLVSDDRHFIHLKTYHMSPDPCHHMRTTGLAEGRVESCA